MMTMNIHYFNPENDLALANGSENYTAPPRAARLRHDLRLLPAWLAQAGDRVLCMDTADRAWLQAQGLEVDVITPADLPRLSEARFAPWGWSRATRRQLLRLGAPEHLLPDAERIDAVHRLSHRRTSIAIHRHLQQLTGHAFGPMPVELALLDDVKQWASQHIGGFIKLPWSGSGQGVYRVLSLDDQHLWQWCAGGLRRQGSLLCEVGLDKVQDFASEWQCTAGQARLVGYSVFDSDMHHQYAGGLVDSRQSLHGLLAGQCPTLDTALEALGQSLAAIVAPHYDGPVGVDMMLYRRPDGRVTLNACVEVNLRCTMGLVTSVLGERHGLRGTFRITDCAVRAVRALTPDTGRFAAVLLPTSAMTAGRC